jgi:DNA (cytosine-5)-methyltransferase 1
MAEIKELPWNGLNVVSTFSGCGGSSLGYRMAGCRVLFASEFVQAARDTYNSNKAPYTIVDDRDIRNLRADDILSAINLKKGELDIFDGSPPCSAFSLAGKRSDGWGQAKRYSDDKVQVVDDLFFEYARLLREIQPKVFIAENVKGLVIGEAKGYFNLIFKELQDCGYNVKASVLNAAFLGVPQTRERLIFIGVRRDLDKPPVFPKPLPYYYSFDEAVEGLVPDEYKMLGSDLEKFWHVTNIGESRASAGERLGIKKGGHAKIKINGSLPCGTLTTAYNDKMHYAVPRTLAINEAKRVCGFPDDFILTGSYAQKYERLARAVPPVMMRAVVENIIKEVFCV